MLDAAGMLFPRPLSSYPEAATLGATLAARIQAEPFNAVATAVFVLAVLHTFLASRIALLAHRWEERRETERTRFVGPAGPSVAVELLRLLGEVEVVFGLWAAVLLIAVWADRGWNVAAGYVSETVDYSEAIDRKSVV